MNNKDMQCIVDNIFSVLPLFKKKLLKPDKYEEDNDLSPSHMQILFYLDDVGRTPISEVGKGLNISKPNMTPLIRKLINKKLIERIRDEKDRRYVNIGITREGKKLIEQHKLLVAKELTVKLNKLNKNDLEKLSTSLNLLKEVILKIE